MPTYTIFGGANGAGKNQFISQFTIKKIKMKKNKYR